MSDSEKHNDASGESSTWDDTRITAYVMGELSTEETSAFEQAMAGDTELRAAVDQAAQLTDQLQALYASETPKSLDGSRRKEILAASLQPAHSITRCEDDARWSRRLVPWLLAAAATLLLAIGVIPAMKRSQLAQSDSDSTDDVARRTLASDAASTEFMVQKEGVEFNDSVALGVKNEAVVVSGSIADAPTAPPISVETQLAESLVFLDKPVVRELRTADQAEQPMTRIAKGTAMNSLAELAGPAPAAATASSLSIVPAPAPTPTPAPPPAPFFRTSRMKGGQAMEDSKKLAQNREAQVYFYESLSKKSVREFESRESKQIEYPAQQAWIEMHTQYQDGDRFEPIVENQFRQVSQHPLSTFSIDVDTASYSKVRRSLVEGRLPRPDAVRIEELVNYFEYNYDAPEADAEHPFATDVTITRCPWNQAHRLARVAIQGKTLDRESRPPCNLVFLLDTSGSMNQPNKLPLVVEGMKMLTNQLGKEDRVAIVVYAGSAGLILDSTSAKKQKKINKALSSLSANGSTAGGAGIRLAYATARDHFIKEGVNRVILCTDGDFNVGLSGTDELVRLIQEESSDGIFLTALGFGMGNHNDAMMEQISGKGNGNYAFIDTANEACKVLVRQTDATLVTIAKDVKLQIEFNPRVYSQYRLIGYENRVMAKEDFNDDQKDAGEIGAGHQVTALYELVPAGENVDEDASVDPLKFQTSPELTKAAAGDEAMSVKLRYKQPDGDTSILIQLDARDNEGSFDESDSDFRFASAVASFGMLLRQSEFAGDWTLENVRQVAAANLAADEFQLRGEFVRLVRMAQSLRGQ